MLRILAPLLMLGLTTTPLLAAPEISGLIIKPSQHGVTETIDRLESALTAKGITIVTRWSHSSKAESVGIPLRPTELLLFGNPKLGSPLMTSRQSVGIDLPLKALAWQDEQGQVWLGYNDPAYIANRHGIDDRQEVVKKMTGALNKFSDIAVSSP